MQHDFKPKINNAKEKTENSEPDVSRDEALAAVRTLIRWAGDDPQREGLIETPERVIRAYEEMFAGYKQDPIALLQKTFEMDGDYSEPVILRKIPFSSYCEHHILPIVGYVDLAYLPKDRVVGLSKLGRVVKVFAHRLQTQEFMTASIGKAIEEGLSPDGVAIHISAVHNCMGLRGLKSPGVVTVTRYYGGLYKTDLAARKDIQDALNVELQD